MPQILFLDHIFPLLQHMLVILALAWLFTRTRVFTALVDNRLTWPDRWVIYLVFSGFCVLGTLFSEQSFQSAEAITNTRAIGAVLGGLLGGPLVGLAVGATGGLHRMFSLSSAADPIHYIDVACALATTAEGLLAGCLHWFCTRRGRSELLFSPKLAAVLTLAAESLHMGVLLLVGWWVAEGGAAWRLVQEIAPPMLLANTLGVVLIIYMIREQKRAADEQLSGRRAWAVANESVGLLQRGLTQESGLRMAQIIQREMRLAAVAITDRERVVAFTGVGADHHVAGASLSEQTARAIADNRVLLCDGVRDQYRCSVTSDCPLGAVLIVPLRDDAEGAVIGTIKMYEVKSRLFSNLNQRLGEEIARWLSTYLLAGRYERQQQLRLQDQYRLLTAKVHPHFLYNALTTVGHIAAGQPQRAQALLQHLSDFFRNSLETAADTTTLRDDVSYLEDYLAIEKARFEARLAVEINIADHLLDCRVPVFTLQPVVENAIKHGTSELLEGGRVSIYSTEEADEKGGGFTLWVEDNSGLYQPRHTPGVGLTLDERIKTAFGEYYGINIECEPQQWTRVAIRLPKKEIS